MRFAGCQQGRSGRSKTAAQSSSSSAGRKPSRSGKRVRGSPSSTRRYVWRIGDQGHALGVARMVLCSAEKELGRVVAAVEEGRARRTVAVERLEVRARCVEVA